MGAYKTKDPIPGSSHHQHLHQNPQLGDLSLTKVATKVMFPEECVCVCGGGGFDDLGGGAPYAAC